jgi:hypothetical protein
VTEATTGAERAEDSARDALAFVAAIDREDTAAVDAILAAADPAYLAGALAMIVSVLLSRLGIRDKSGLMQIWQRKFSMHTASTQVNDPALPAEGGSGTESRLTMVRKNPARQPRKTAEVPAEPLPPWFIPDAEIQAAREAHQRAAAAATAGEWSGAGKQQAAAEHAARERLEGLLQLRADQEAQESRRVATLKEAGPELSAMASQLAATRDTIAAAAIGHLRALSALAVAADAHNEAVAAGRARLTELGLSGEHDIPEGVIYRGARVGGTDWLPIAAGAIVAHALRQVFESAGAGHPLYQAGRYAWTPDEVYGRRDGLVMPTLQSAGATVPQPREGLGAA